MHLNRIKLRQMGNIYSSKSNGMLNVTFINGVLNVLRLLIENNKISDIQNYKGKLKDIDKFDFKKYKSSQYRKMGKDIYAKYFEMPYDSMRVVF